MLMVSLLLRVAAAQDITKAKQEGRIVFYTS